MGASGGLAVLFVKDGLEAGNILAEGAQLVGFLHLAGLFAHTQLEELLAQFAELGGDLDWREFADFFRSHGRMLRVLLGKRNALAGDKTAVKRQLGVGQAESLLGNRR